MKFERWNAQGSTTWAYQVFARYDDELMKLWGAHLSASAYTFSQLGKNGADWSDKPNAHFQAGVLSASFCRDLGEWKEASHSLTNWVNLSVILTLASNLETYLANVVETALQSDPGVLVGASRAVDGAALRKTGRLTRADLRPHIERCTKGDWSSRLSALESWFGVAELAEIRQAHSGLEAVRKIRNDFGHALGRDIQAAQTPGGLAPPPVTRVGRERAEKLRETVRQVAKALDRVLLKGHIGEYEAVRFYGDLHSTPGTQVSPKDLKKAIGGHGAASRGRDYCASLASYWHSL